MNADKLSDIIKRKNERLEDEAAATAEQLINRIVQLQADIATSSEEIKGCQQELQKLEVKSVDAAKILGS